MGDEKVISFDKLQEKINAQEQEKFEMFMNSLCHRYEAREINIMQVYEEVFKYRKENNIDQKKMEKMELNILKKMQLDFGLDGNENEEEEMAKIKDRLLEVFESEKGLMDRRLFMDVYRDQIKEDTVLKLSIKNDKNDLNVIFDHNKVYLFSEKKINFGDEELNKLITLYREAVEKEIKILSCEATAIYEYH